MTTRKSILYCTQDEVNLRLAQVRIDSFRATLGHVASSALALEEALRYATEKTQWSEASAEYRSLASLERKWMDYAAALETVEKEGT